MKLLVIVTFMLLSITAQASPFLVMDFNKDVKIFLSTTTACKTGGLRAYAARIDGQHVNGCYAPKTIDGKLWIRIVWELPDGQGDFTELTAASFTKVNDNPADNFKVEF